MSRVTSSDSVSVMLIGDLPRIQKSDEVKLQFTPYGDSFESKFYYGEMDNKTSVLMVIDGIAPFDTTEENADKFVWQSGDWRARPDLVAGLDGIIIDPDRNDAMHFQTGSMRGIIAALDKCTDGLAVYWGLDIEALKGKRQSAEPVGSTQEWLKDFDFLLAWRFLEKSA